MYGYAPGLLHVRDSPALSNQFTEASSRSQDLRRGAFGELQERGVLELVSPADSAVVGLRSAKTDGVMPGIRRSPGVRASDTCHLAELYLSHGLSRSARSCLALGCGWVRRWTVSWRMDGGEVESPVRDLASLPVSSCRPVRGFTWRMGQRHRPGLQYVVSTGRHHGFESMAEQRLLLALDFVGVQEVVSQPLRLRFATDDGWRVHVPDFLAVLPDGWWLFDVRPEGQATARDEESFAAATEVALAAGWGYAVVAGWRPHVMTTLDTLSSQRRPLGDPLGLRPRLLELADGGPRPFSTLVAATQCPAVARAQLLHLLWHRAVGVDLGRPLGNHSLVWLVESGSRG